jgi:5-methyltetrahydropteroyltriglutamate--homocysteine methyltransferase
MLCDPDVRSQAAAHGGEPAALLDTYLGLVARILVDRPADMTTAMHLCRGNFRSRWMASGGYEPVADKLFNLTPVDVFLLEYDTDRAGDFSPLRFVPEGKRVVLGLVSSKSPALEDQDLLLRRIEEAARYCPLERLALSAQCGFASVAGGNALTEDQQWAKLELIVDTAQRVWR